MSSTQYPPHTDLKFIQCKANSFLPTGRHSGFLINTLTHTRTHTGKHHSIISRLFLCVAFCVRASCRPTNTQSHNHSECNECLYIIYIILIIWVELIHAVKVTLTISRSLQFQSSKILSLSTAGSRPGGIKHAHTHTEICGGVSLWPLTSSNLSRNQTCLPLTFFSFLLTVWGSWRLVWVLIWYHCFHTYIELILVALSYKLFTQTMEVGHFANNYKTYFFYWSPMTRQIFSGWVFPGCNGPWPCEANLSLQVKNSILKTTMLLRSCY